jgi:hypothetical protein
MVSLAVSLYVLRGVGLVGVGLGLVGLAIDTALPCGWVVTCFVFICGGWGSGDHIMKRIYLLMLC